MILFKYRALTFCLMLLTQLLVFGCTSSNNEDKNVTTENIDLPCKLNDSIYKDLFFGISETQYKQIAKQEGFNTLKANNDSFFFKSKPSFYKDKLCKLELEFYNWDTIIDQSNNLINFKDAMGIIDNINSYAALSNEEQKEQSKKQFQQRKYKAEKELAIPGRLQKVLNLYTTKYGKPLLDDTLYMGSQDYVSGGMYIWNCNKYSIKIEFVVKRERINEPETDEFEIYDLLEKFIIRYYDDEVYNLYYKQEQQKDIRDIKNFEEEKRQKKASEENKKKLEQSNI